MKIAFVTQPGHKVLPAAGSLEIWTENVARRLAERHEVTVYASAPADRVVTEEGVRHELVRHDRDGLIHRIGRGAYRLLPADLAFFSSMLHPLGYWTRLGRDLRRERPDVVHVFNYSQAIPLLRRFVPSAKFVLHMQCEWLTQLNRGMIDRRLAKTDLMVGCSDHITSGVIRRFPRHADRCVTIYNGVDVDALATAPLPSPQGRPLRLLNLGRVSPEKGIHVLVEAFNRLSREYPQLELVIVGDDAVVPVEMAVKIAEDPLVQALGRFYDDDYPALVRAQLTSESAARVTFVGRVEHAETQRFYREADIFVFPSIFESFAIPPVEAMAAGLPVVASRVGGIQETLVDDATGIFVQREDAEELAAAIRRLLDDADLRRRFGEAGRARARAMFAWPRIAADVEETFGRLAESRVAGQGRRADLVDLA